ncbi:hypothetical protein BV20DRAFT_471147 [Pilatotrama ljubarskyi]|nr:hypothetical protein BV20DRAFT_471147 [Pilatotrama ljubarskyi]
MSASLLCLLALLQALLAPGYSQSSPAQTFFPASIPLAVRSPYMSVWYNASAGAKPLSESWPLFWGRSSIMDMQGAIRVDNQTYIWMGVDHPSTGASNASMTNVQITPTRSIFTMQTGPMNVTVAYISPIEPADWVLQSLPFSYISVEATSMDGQSHDVQVYAEITGEWLSDDWSRSIQWNHDVTNKGIILNARLESPQSFTDINQQARDGVAYIATAARPGITWQIAADASCRSQFHTYGNLTNVSSEAFRPISMDTPVFAVAVDLGQIQETSFPVSWAVGYVRDPSIAYTAADGTTHNLSPYFLTRYSDGGITQAINDFTAAFPEALERSIVLDNAIIGNASKISSEYADLVSLAARQVLGSVDITVSKGTDGKPNATDVNVFMKEIGAATATGRVNPVEQIYAALPMLLYLNTSLIRPLLAPLLDAQDGQSGPYAAQDIGPAYPNATGTQGAHQQGIEQSGNMLIMLYAHARFSGDGTLIQRHYSLTKRWADYLVKNTLMPSNQLSADTEIQNGPNMTNLAVKGIIGVKAMAEMSRALGEDADAQHYNDQAATLGASWHSLAPSSDGQRILGVYGDQESWSLIYNLYYDRLLGTNIVNQTLLRYQTAFYKTLLETSYQFGLPITNSAGGITNAAWLLFTAATVLDDSVRDDLIRGVWTRASFNGTAGPFPDVYDSASGATGAGSNANGGPAFGAVFSLLALSLPDKPIIASVGQPLPGTPGGNSTPHGTGPSKTAAIVGGVVGGIALIALVFAGTFFVLRCCHRVSQGHLKQKYNPANVSHIHPLSPPHRAVRFMIDNRQDRRIPRAISEVHSRSSLHVVTSNASIFLPSPVSSNEAAPSSKLREYLLQNGLGFGSRQSRRPLPNALRPTTAGREPNTGVAISPNAGHGAVVSTPSRVANLRAEVEQLRQDMQDIRGVFDLPPDYTSDV